MGRKGRERKGKEREKKGEDEKDRKRKGKGRKEKNKRDDKGQLSFLVSNVTYIDEKNLVKINKTQTNIQKTSLRIIQGN